MHTLIPIYEKNTVSNKAFESDAFRFQNAKIYLPFLRIRAAREFFHIEGRIRQNQRSICTIYPIFPSATVI